MALKKFAKDLQTILIQIESHSFLGVYIELGTDFLFSKWRTFSFSTEY
jgi:hypothetical protein